MKQAQKQLRFAVLATDVALFTIFKNSLMVRLIKVNRPPYFKDQSGLPGGLIKPNETAEAAVARLIRDKAGVNASKVYFEQLYTFSKVNRDPRGRVVSVGYLALVPWEALTTIEQEGSRESRWEVFAKAKDLAYDHDQILSLALARLRSRITYTTVSSKLVPKEFTLTHLEKICEVVLNTEIDKRNFRKKLLNLKIVKKSNRQLRGVKHRPANLYSFASLQVKDIAVL